LSGRADKFLKLSGREKMLFLEAVVLHLWIGLLLKVIPFRRIPRFFASPKSKVESPDAKVIELIRDAVARANRVSPWRNRCLVSSLAGRCMLRSRRIQSQISLGVAKGSDGKMVAHAWLRSGEIEIVERRGDYTELFSF
jgi:hypothetical protein